MRISPIRNLGATGFEIAKSACQILILYEDFSDYSRAVEVCRRLMDRLGSDLDFDIRCWNFVELAIPHCGRHAAKNARAADIILLSMHSLQPPLELARWMDDFFTARPGADGVLALVFNRPNCPPTAMKDLVSRLGSSARRLGMDFLPSDNEGMLSSLVVAHPVNCPSPIAGFGS